MWSWDCSIFVSFLVFFLSFLAPTHRNQGVRPFCRYAASQESNGRNSKLFHLRALRIPCTIYIFISGRVWKQKINILHNLTGHLARFDAETWVRYIAHKYMYIYKCNYLFSPEHWTHSVPLTIIYSITVPPVVKCHQFYYSRKHCLLTRRALFTWYSFPSFHFAFQNYLFI